MTAPSRLSKTERRTAPVRWRETGWEMRCEGCTKRGGARFWPLTDEFWNKRQLTACRACIAEQSRAAERRRNADPEYRARAAVVSAEYRRDARREIAFKERLRYYDDRDAIRARRRARYAELKEDLNARRREQYAEARAA